MKSIAQFITFIILSASLVRGARILALFTHFGKSHFDVFEPYVKELAVRGHQVTVLSHFPQKQPIANYTDISLVGSVPTNSTNRLDMNTVNSGISMIQTMVKELSELYKSCDRTLSFHSVQELLKSKQVFDAIITETFLTDCFLPFIHKFNAPNIAISSSIMFQWSNDRMGNPDNPSYIPTHGLWFSDRMNFGERILNIIINEFAKTLHSVMRGIVEQGYASKHFGDDIPSLSDIARNTSLLLVNTHFSLNRPRPLVPGIVEVGGIHIKPPKKLPKDLEDYLNGAEHGVILFSMGSLIRVETLPVEKRDAILQAFSELPQRVLLKWEGENMPGLPKNVRTLKWIPQFDVLNHPKVRVYMGHGGNLGTIEAVYAGVPMVGIPIIGDQFMNIKSIVMAGMGVHLGYSNITKESVLDALRAVLDQPSYKENAKRMSQLYQDRPMSAMDTAIYWTEYVIRHKGAPHLRTAAVDLPWYQYLLLDVLVVITIVVLALLYITYIITRTLLRRIISGISKNKSKQS